MGNDIIRILSTFIMSNSESNILKNLRKLDVDPLKTTPFCLTQNMVYLLAEILVNRALPDIKTHNFKKKYDALKLKPLHLQILGETWRVLNVITRIVNSSGYAWTSQPNKLMLCNDNLFIGCSPVALEYLNFIICYLARSDKITFYNEQIVACAWMQARKKIINVFDEESVDLLEVLPELTLHLPDRVRVSNVTVWSTQQDLFINISDCTEALSAIPKKIARDYIFNREGTYYCIPEEAMEYVGRTAKIALCKIDRFSEELG